MEVRYKPHHAGNTPEQRIASRLRNSGGDTNPDHCIQKGEGPTRAFTNIHHSGQQQHGEHLDVRTKPTPKERDTGRFPKED
jgi:hypothetical protein